MYSAEDLLAMGFNPEDYGYIYSDICNSYIKPNEDDETTFEYVTRNLRDVLANHCTTTLMPLNKDDYDEVVRALKECGWNPISCQNSKKTICKEMLAELNECQIFYNRNTKKRYAFLGYASAEKQYLVLKILG